MIELSEYTLRGWRANQDRSVSAAEILQKAGNLDPFISVLQRTLSVHVIEMKERADELEGRAELLQQWLLRQIMESRRSTYRQMMRAR